MERKIEIDGSLYTIKELSQKLKELEAFKNPIVMAKQMIASKGITQAEIAKRMGVSQACVSQQLGDFRKPSAKWLYKLSKAIMDEK